METGPSFDATAQVGGALAGVEEGLAHYFEPAMTRKGVFSFFFSSFFPAPPFFQQTSLLLRSTNVPFLSGQDCA